MRNRPIAVFIDPQRGLRGHAGRRGGVPQAPDQSEIADLDGEARTAGGGRLEQHVAATEVLFFLGGGARL